MKENIRLLNEIIEQIRNVSKEDLDMAIRMIEEKNRIDNLSEILKIENNEYKETNRYYEEKEKYEYYDLHIKSTSNIFTEEAA